jgi:Kef-type K+ transport system membrane component KefB
VGFGRFFKQPLILDYLIAGFFIGPFDMGWLKSQESISVISELDLTFILFMIVLDIDLKKIVVGSSCLPPADSWWAAACSACSS